MSATPTVDRLARGGNVRLAYENDGKLEASSKHSAQMLGGWQKVKLALDACRRFRRFLMTENHTKHTVNDTSVQKFKEDCSPTVFAIGTNQLRNLMEISELQAIQSLGGVTGLSNLLKTDLRCGFQDCDALIEERRATFGSNEVPLKPGKGPWAFIWDACHNTTVIILMLCAAMLLGAEMWSGGPGEGWYDGASIAVSLTVFIALTAISEYWLSLQFQFLFEKEKNVQVAAIRGGIRCKLSVSEIVVGDIISLGTGDQVPADGILVAEESLAVDECTMTGNSVSVHKCAEQPFLVAGSKIVTGRGNILIVAVGINTKWAQLLSLPIKDKAKETLLQMRLKGIAKFMSRVGLTCAVVVLGILSVKFFLFEFKTNKSASNAIRKMLNIIALAIAFVAVPQGLRLAMAVLLVCSMRRMMKDKCLVRNLAACETMGLATTICSDKTGTLTLNEMTVVMSWVAGKLVESDKIRCIAKGPYEMLLNGLCQNSSGSVFIPEDGGNPEVSGSPTESAVLRWGFHIGMNYDAIKRTTSIVQVEAFNSTRKRAGVVIRRAEGDVEVHWKGAAEMILEDCKNWVDENGAIFPMTSDKALELNNCIDSMAAKGLRCIAFAYSSLQEVPPVEKDGRDWKMSYEDLTFLCVIGIKDPCRPGIREAVRKCEVAGVKVRMVTGDSLLTAQAIAVECGILTSTGELAEAVEGRMFREFSKEEMDEMLPRIAVVARASPSDKLLLATELKKRGEVVVVTGDGSNDAPALREADIGLSMGISGTDVAKRSSDIVILDDNFASIVKMVKWGRFLCSTIQELNQTQLTINFTALVLYCLSAWSSGNVPSTAAHLLWVYPIIDTLGVLAIGMRTLTDDLMGRLPFTREECLKAEKMSFEVFMTSLTLIQALWSISGKDGYLYPQNSSVPFERYGAIGSMGYNRVYKFAQYLRRNNDPNDKVRAYTLGFNTIVMFQLYNEVTSQLWKQALQEVQVWKNARRRPKKKSSVRRFFKNHLFWGIVAIKVAFQFMTVQVFNKFATTKALTWWEWLACVIWAAVSCQIARVFVALTDVSAIAFKRLPSFGVVISILFSLQQILEIINAGSSFPFVMYIFSLHLLALGIFKITYHFYHSFFKTKSHTGEDFALGPPNVHQSLV